MDELELDALFSAARAAPADTARGLRAEVARQVSALDSVDKDELDRSLRVLLLADAAAKESRLSSEDQLLASLVLQLCTRTGHTAA